MSRAERNRPELWDGVWAGDVSLEEDHYALAHEEAGARWRRIEAHVTTTGGFEGLHVIEIGAGAGTNAALMAARGAHVTILDFSQAAIERSREFFGRNHVHAEWVRADALDLPRELAGAFDIAMSFGLAEHFTGDARRAILASHLEAVRPGGTVFVSVPNRANLPYRLFKLVAGRTRVWKVGEEYPFSRRELARIAKELSVTDYGFFGDSVFYSLRFVSPLHAMRKLLGREKRDVSRIRRRWATPLDSRFAYALVLWAKRPKT